MSRALLSTGMNGKFQSFPIQALEFETSAAMVASMKIWNGRVFDTCLPTGNAVFEKSTVTGIGDPCVFNELGE